MSTIGGSATVPPRRIVTVSAVWLATATSGVLSLSKSATVRSLAPAGTLTGPPRSKPVLAALRNSTLTVFETDALTAMSGRPLPSKSPVPRP